MGRRCIGQDYFRSTAGSIGGEPRTHRRQLTCVGLLEGPEAVAGPVRLGRGSNGAMVLNFPNAPALRAGMMKQLGCTYGPSLGCTYIVVPSSVTCRLSVRVLCCLADLRGSYLISQSALSPSHAQRSSRHCVVAHLTHLEKTRCSTCALFLTDRW